MHDMSAMISVSADVSLFIYLHIGVGTMSKITAILILVAVLAEIFILRGIILIGFCKYFGTKE